MAHSPSSAPQALSPYHREYPTIAAIEQMTLGDLQTLTKTLEEDIGLIEEESRMFSHYIKLTKEKDAQAARVDVDEDDDGQIAVAASGAGAQSTGGRRRGKGYAHRRTSDPKDVFLSMEDKQTVLTAEQDRLKQDREKGERVLEDARDLIRATIEEAQNRSKEVKMELGYFKREVAPDREVSAEKILKYFADRPAQKDLYLKKLKEKCTSLHQSIAKFNSQLKQREDVGEAFHAIDFDQLKIENMQFNERIEQKNDELVELKGTTTRTVQSLNNLTDRLNALLAEQTQLRSTLRQKQDHVGKLAAEIEMVRKEGALAQKKNITLKLQNEAVKVPKVEDYIAQKAECYELEKAALNWQRKVEIANGHVAVMKQQMLSLRKVLDPQLTVDKAASKGKGKSASSSVNLPSADQRRGRL